MDNFITNFFTRDIAPNPGLNIVLAIIFAIVLAIKGIALFHAARADEKPWFVALLVLNTFGILDLVYLFYFSKNKLTPQQVNRDLRKLIARGK